ncbi:hypothetical protein KVR01_004198 [Diaporthe batatas]|uniref:uncharacterized protein n=1 Tax=Diaporthe batatas TaxID=748121 RepID=UPI001D052978|nr:uncharacterized protein KVR01_004198 [Diaporthe batatas]KAG8165646.1 hypothetical protein KVR01_004198 [Diaporthe batatas]
MSVFGWGSSPSGTNEKLIIALDFGTTFSGIAYCFAGQKGAKVATIQQWPGAQGESVPKVPTLINYPSADKTHFKWGAEVDRFQDNIVGVKLLLDPSQERPQYLPTVNMKETLDKLPKEPVSVAADFISALYKHALSEISKAVPIQYFERCKKEFVLSVPAVLSDAAKSATIKAAESAGMFPVTLIKEPEAAALYTMHSLGFSLKIGDAFVVCDAGGGTVDLISYEVVGLDPEFQVKELVPGTGNMAGSLGLNQRFVEAVKKLVVKRSFHGDSEEEYFLNFPMANLEDKPDHGLQSNCWRMTGEDLKNIFAPLVDDILALINDQIKSAYRKRQNHTRRVTSTCSTKHYGVAYWAVHDPLVDVGVPISNPWRDGTKRSERIGDDIGRDQKIEFPFFRDIDGDYSSADLIFVDELYQCDTQDAPLHPSKGPKLDVNCRLTSDLRGVPSHHFQINHDLNWKPYYRVNYKLIVSLESALMTFSLEIGGKQMGKVEAKF